MCKFDSSPIHSWSKQFNCNSYSPHIYITSDNNPAKLYFHIILVTKLEKSEVEKSGLSLIQKLGTGDM